MPRSSAADAALTAKRIRDHALRLFSELGFTEVTIEDVARAAAVTRGAIYHHFHSKYGLFRAVARHLHAEVAAKVVAAADTSHDALGRLRAGSQAFLTAITETTTARILLIDAPAVMGWQEWRALDATHSQTHLEGALEDAGTPADRRATVTALLSGAMNEAALWIAHQENPQPALATAHEELDRLLTSMLTQT